MGCHECKSQALSDFSAANAAAFATLQAAQATCKDLGEPDGCMEAALADYFAAINLAYVTLALALFNCPCGD